VPNSCDVHAHAYQAVWAILAAVAVPNSSGAARNTR